MWRKTLSRISTAMPPKRSQMGVTHGAANRRSRREALLAEAALAVDWNRPEEDAAWCDVRRRV